MSSAARRRLVRDFRRLQSDPPSGVTAAPLDCNILVKALLCILVDIVLFRFGKPSFSVLMTRHGKAAPLSSN